MLCVKFKYALLNSIYDRLKLLNSKALKGLLIDFLRLIIIASIKLTLLTKESILETKDTTIESLNDERFKKIELSIFSSYTSAPLFYNVALKGYLAFSRR